MKKPTQYSHEEWLMNNCREREMLLAEHILGWQWYKIAPTSDEEWVSFNFPGWNASNIEAMPKDFDYKEYTGKKDNAAPDFSRCLNRCWELEEVFLKRKQAPKYKSLLESRGGIHATAEERCLCMAIASGLIKEEEHYEKEKTK